MMKREKEEFGNDEWEKILVLDPFNLNQLSLSLFYSSGLALFSSYAMHGSIL
jgi:hypothetical protein